MKNTKSSSTAFPILDHMANLCLCIDRPKSFLCVDNLLVVLEFCYFPCVINIISILRALCSFGYFIKMASCVVP